MDLYKPVLTGMGRRQAGVVIRLASVHSEYQTGTNSNMQSKEVNFQPGDAGPEGAVGQEGDSQGGVGHGGGYLSLSEDTGQGQGGVILRWGDVQEDVVQFDIELQFQLQQFTRDQDHAQEQQSDLGNWDPDQFSWEPEQQTLENSTTPPNVAEILSKLLPVPESEVPKHLKTNPIPSLPELKIPATQRKPKKSTKGDIDPQKSTVSKINRNLGLREEQAEIAKRFHENIAIRVNSEGLKYFQCNLCQGIHFISTLKGPFFRLKRYLWVIVPLSVLIIFDLSNLQLSTSLKSTIYN